jgi:hypothetical protein
MPTHIHSSPTTERRIQARPAPMSPAAEAAAVLHMNPAARRSLLLGRADAEAQWVVQQTHEAMSDEARPPSGSGGLRILPDRGRLTVMARPIGAERSST